MPKATARPPLRPVISRGVPLEFAGGAAGALYAGPGWDVAFLGLGLYLADENVGDPRAWESSPDVQRYSAKVIDAWAEVASAQASQEEIAAAKEAARAQFAPDL